MKSLHISKKGTPQGNIDFKIAFNGKLIAIKGAMNTYAGQFIEQYRQQGAKVIEKREGFIVDIFYKGQSEGQTFFKLGSHEIDLEIDAPTIIENKLCQFYIDLFSKAGFDVE